MTQFKAKGDDASDDATDAEFPPAIGTQQAGINVVGKGSAGSSDELEVQRLRAYAHLLDSAIPLPGGFSIGLDGIVGLIPVGGDLLGAALSGYFIYAASRLDIPRAVIHQMIFNTAVETLVGMVPVVGDLFDFAFKSNDRNSKLLQAALDARTIRQESID